MNQTFIIITLLLTIILFSCKNTTEPDSLNQIGSASENKAAAPSTTVIGPYNKTLSLLGISFHIQSPNNSSINQMTIQTNGLVEKNDSVTGEIDGLITNAEVADLNNDGSPELLVYITSAGSGSYGTVMAYSVNDKKSMSRAYFANFADNPKVNKGYMGHDEFSISGTSLIHRFPIYNKTDTNAIPTGGTRQIEYKLVQGPKWKGFIIVKITDIPN